MSKQIEGKIVRIEGGVVTVSVKSGQINPVHLLPAVPLGLAFGPLGAIAGAAIGGVLEGVNPSSKEVSIPLDKVSRIDHETGTVTLK